MKLDNFEGKHCSFKVSETDETFINGGNGMNGMEHDHNGQTVEDDEEIVFSEWSEPPIKRSKLQVPAFVQHKPARATWRPIEPPKPSSKLGIEMICPNICFFFLRDECVEGENCYDSHTFPSESDVSQSLNACGPEKAAKLLHVIVARCPKLLELFFHTFIDFLVQNNAKDDLIEAIAICEREQDKNKQFTFFQHLTKALIRIGETYTTAMETILMNLQCARSDIVDTLLNMNLVDDIRVGDFLSVFRSLNQKRYRFNHLIIDRLMYLCSQSESVLPSDKLHEFLRLIFNILRKNRPAQKLLNKNYYNCYMMLYRKAHSTPNFGGNKL